MTTITQIVSYWQNNIDVPLWTDLVPDGTPFPYASLHLVSQKSNYTTGSLAFQYCRFQISIFDITLDSVSSIAEDVDAAFNRSTTVTSNEVQCNQLNSMNLPIELADQQIVYGWMLEYELQVQISVPG